MATEAETLLAGSGWLPEPLRTPGRVMPATSRRRDRERRAIEPTVAETAADGGESAVVADDATVEDEEAADG